MAKAPKNIQLKVLKGTNSGDTINLSRGTCRLVGRHLAENETIMLGLDGNRVLDTQEVATFDQALTKAVASARRGLNAFERGADIVLADEAVSRAHAMVFFDDQGGGVVDLASTNGTFVNDKPLTAAILKAGDRIKFGKTVIEVLDE